SYVSVIGDFNGWNTGSHPLRARESSGIWEGFIPGLGAGAAYKYHVGSRHEYYQVNKADPFAFVAETPPKTASRVGDLSYTWGDEAWMAQSRSRNALDGPIAVYEVHLGSW